MYNSRTVSERYCPLNIEINPLFDDELRNLTNEEWQTLFEDVKQNGCLDSIKLWRNQIVDGHNRYHICTELGLDFNIDVLEFEDQEQALDWIRRNQLGKRNLTKDEFTLLLGRRYNASKKTKSEAGAIGGSNHQNEGCLTTAEKIAAEHGVSKATVERAGAKAAAIDSAVPELQKAVKQNEASLTAAVTVANLPEEQQVAIVEQGPEAVNEAATEIRKERKTLVTQNSGNNEWYTPPEYIEAAREVMSGIDCDPASNDFAQKTIKASEYFTAQRSGLDERWSGTVWLNPPYEKGLVDKFISKYCTEDDVTEGIVLVNNATDTEWFHKLASVSDAVCLKKGRIRYIAADGLQKNTPIQGQAFLYRGANADKFESIFSGFGAIARFAK